MRGNGDGERERESQELVKSSCSKKQCFLPGTRGSWDPNVMGESRNVFGKDWVGSDLGVFENGVPQNFKVYPLISTFPLKVDTVWFSQFSGTRRRPDTAHEVKFVLHRNQDYAVISQSYAYDILEYSLSPLNLTINEIKSP